MKKTALAIFVKTVGMSSVKTRLAKSLGKEFAEIFFLACVEHLQEILKPLQSEMDLFWAVAEKEGENRWKEFPVLSQGQGDLGQRLSTIFDQLRKYEYVFFIGADSPMLTSIEIFEALQLLKEGKDFVFGPTEDGGFYLFGGKKPVSKDLWTGIAYSQNDTLEKLESALTPLGKIARIKTLLDIDEEADLKKWFLMENPNHPVIQRVKGIQNINYATLIK